MTDGDRPAFSRGPRWERLGHCPVWCQGHPVGTPNTGLVTTHITELVYVGGWPEDHRLPAAYVAGVVASYLDGPHVMVMRAEKAAETRVDLSAGDAAKLAVIVDDVAPSLAVAIREVLALLAGEETSAEGE